MNRKIAAILIITLATSITLTACKEKEIQYGNKSHKEFTGQITTENRLATNIKTLRSVNIAIEDIKTTSLHAYKDNVTIGFSDLKGATVEVSFIHFVNGSTILKKIDNSTPVTISNVPDGRYLTYITKLTYSDGTISDKVSTIKPLYLGDVVVDESGKDEAYDKDENGTLINNTIKTPILRYNSSIQLSAQTSEIKEIGSESITIAPYPYLKSKMESVQFVLIDKLGRKESEVKLVDSLQSYTFDKLQPNSEYTIGYRVLNRTMQDKEGNDIEGVWSNYITTKVYTNASKKLSVTQGDYKDGVLELHVTANINETMPYYMLKIMPTHTAPTNIISGQATVSVVDKNGVDVTKSMTISDTLYVKGLKPEEVQSVYVTDVKGVNMFKVPTIPNAEEGSDAAIVKVADIAIATLTTSDADLAALLYNTESLELPIEFKGITNTKLKSVLNELANKDRVKAARFYKELIGIDNVKTVYNKDFNIKSYTRLTGNIYYSNSGPINCIEYVEYKQPGLSKPIIIK